MRAWRLVLVVAALGLMAAAGCDGPAPTPSPTVRPTPTPVPGPTLVPAGTLRVVAVNLQLSPRALQTAANTAFDIHFGNEEPGSVPHVVDLRLADGTTVVQEQEPIPGGEDVTYRYRPVPAGDYVFMCRVHPIPAMTGTLRVR